MHTFIQFIGGLAVVIGLAICGYAAFRFLGGIGDTAFGWLTYGLATATSGAVLYCFGAIVDHLESIRDGLESDRRSRK